MNIASVTKYAALIAALVIMPACGVQTDGDDETTANDAPAPEPKVVTPAVPDTTPPEVLTLEVIDITASSATVHVITNEITGMQVQYNLTATAQPLHFATEHSLGLTDLYSDTTYKLYVTIRDIAKNETRTETTFTTARY
ncbi:MAG: hypothetical protein RLZZ324_780 [Candidatus Parcubacteria bacterium]|jgi:hypothetical protein